MNSSWHQVIRNNFSFLNDIGYVAVEDEVDHEGQTGTYYGVIFRKSDIGIAISANPSMKSLHIHMIDFSQENEHFSVRNWLTKHEMEPQAEWAFGPLEGYIREMADWFRVLATGPMAPIVIDGEWEHVDFNWGDYK